MGSFCQDLAIVFYEPPVLVKCSIHQTAFWVELNWFPCCYYWIKVCHTCLVFLWMSACHLHHVMHGSVHHFVRVFPKNKYLERGLYILHKKHFHSASQFRCFTVFIWSSRWTTWKVPKTISKQSKKDQTNYLGLAWIPAYHYSLVLWLHNLSGDRWGMASSHPVRPWFCNGPDHSLLRCGILVSPLAGVL